MREAGGYPVNRSKKMKLNLAPTCRSGAAEWSFICIKTSAKLSLQTLNDRVIKLMGMYPSDPL